MHHVCVSPPALCCVAVLMVLSDMYLELLRCSVARLFPSRFQLFYVSTTAYITSVAVGMLVRVAGPLASLACVDEPHSLVVFSQCVA